MERGIRLFLVLAFMLLASVEVKAEGDDFGIWTEVGVEKKITKKLSLEGGLELRTATMLRLLTAGVAVWEPVTNLLTG